MQLSSVIWYTKYLLAENDVIHQSYHLVTTWHYIFTCFSSVLKSQDQQFLFLGAEYVVTVTYTGYVVLLQIKRFYLYGINVKFENINVE